MVELNPDVKGDWKEADPVALIGSEPAFFDSFSLVIAAQLPSKALQTLGALLWARGTPLIAARSYGLLGSVRVQLPEHESIESHPEGHKIDLRVHESFPALDEFVASLKIEELRASAQKELEAGEEGDASMAFMHVPWPALLVHARQQWEKANGGELPKDREGKAQFLKSLQGLSLSYDQENVAQASTVYYQALSPVGVGFETKEVMDDAAASDEALAKPGCKDFWFLVRALREFLGSEGGGSRLPVTGELPDMHSSTANYIALQKVYGGKHAEDRAAFEAHLGAALAKAGRKLEDFDGELTSRFLKNVRDIRVLRTRSIAQELSVEEDDVEVAKESAEESIWDTEEELRPQMPALWYCVLRAADEFQAAHGHFPGMEDAALEKDAEEVHALAGPIAERLGMKEVEGGGYTKDHAVEITRYGACEPHAIAAIVGATASQEAIKVITHQFFPINNTFLFNGIASVGATLQL